jgi:hypothetical protein
VKPLAVRFTVFGSVNVDVGIVWKAHTGESIGKYGQLGHNEVQGEYHAERQNPAMNKEALKSHQEKRSENEREEDPVLWRIHNVHQKSENI